MTIEELNKKVDDLERKLDVRLGQVVTNDFQGNVAFPNLRIIGTPNNVWYDLKVDNTNASSPIVKLTNIGKKGT